MGPEIPEFLTRILQRLFGSRNERIVKSLRVRAEDVSVLEPEMEKLSDAEPLGLTETFRQEYHIQAEDQGLVALEEERRRHEATNDAELVREVRRKIRPLDRQILDAILPRAFAAVREAA